MKSKPPRARQTLLAAGVGVVFALLAAPAGCVSTTPPALVDSGPGTPMPDSATVDSGDAGQPTCTVSDASVGNELGVGMYCLKNRNQCASVLFCSADFVPPSYGFCTKICKVDADCGSGNFCYTYPTDQGGVSVCVPLACQAGDGGAGD